MTGKDWMIKKPVHEVSFNFLCCLSYMLRYLQMGWNWNPSDYSQLQKMWSEDKSWERTKTEYNGSPRVPHSNTKAELGICSEQEKRESSTLFFESRTFFTERFWVLFESIWNKIMAKTWQQDSASSRTFYYESVGQLIMFWSKETARSTTGNTIKSKEKSHSYSAIQVKKAAAIKSDIARNSGKYSTKKSQRRRA